MFFYDDDDDDDDESPTKFTTGEMVNYPKPTYRHNVRSTMRTIDRMVDRYIVLKTSREIY